MNPATLAARTKSRWTRTVSGAPPGRAARWRAHGRSTRRWWSRWLLPGGEAIATPPGCGAAHAAAGPWLP